MTVLSVARKIRRSGRIAALPRGSPLACMIRRGICGTETVSCSTCAEIPDGCTLQFQWPLRRDRIHTPHSLETWRLQGRCERPGTIRKVMKGNSKLHLHSIWHNRFPSSNPVVVFVSVRQRDRIAKKRRRAFDWLGFVNHKPAAKVE